MMKLALATMALVVLTACVDRKSYETDPVTLKTDQGNVICQLYTNQHVLWDESIAHPKAMTQKTADGICWAEGVRLQKEHIAKVKAR